MRLRLGHLEDADIILRGDVRVLHKEHLRGLRLRAVLSRDCLMPTFVRHVQILDLLGRQFLDRAGLHFIGQILQLRLRGTGEGEGGEGQAERVKSFHGGPPSFLNLQYCTFPTPLQPLIWLIS